MPGGFQLKTEVLANSACSLCGACLDWCPYFKNIEDHLVMTFDCIVQDGRCYAACPRTFTDWEAVRRKFFDDRLNRIEVGTVAGVYKVKARTPAMYQQDGGTVTAMVKIALDKKKAEAALLTGTKDCLTPWPVLTGDLNEVKKSAGSRFLVAPSMRKLVEAKAQGVKDLVIVGRPCQIQAVRKLQFNRPSELPPDGVTTIGLFCMWSLSWAFTKLVQERLPGSRIVRLSIPQHGLEVVTDQGQMVVSVDEVRQYISPGCRLCMDMTSEMADISVGALEIEPGWNTVIVRNDRGLELFKMAQAEGELIVEDYPEDEFKRLQLASFNKKVRALRNLEDSVKNKGMTPFVDLSAEPYKEMLAHGEGEVIG